MLAALLQNNNNARQQPGFKVDPRATAGRSRHVPADSAPSERDTSSEHRPSYDIADILAAAATFPEISGEDPMTRTVRRLRWISEALPFIKETREKSAAAAFLAGVQLGAAAMHAELAALAASEKLSIEQLVQIIDEVRAAPPSAPVLPPLAARAKEHPLIPVPRGRGAASSGLGGAVIVLGLVLGGALIGSRLSTTRRKRRGM